MQKLIALAGSLTPFKLCIVLVVAVLLAFARRSAWNEWWHYIIKNKIYKAQNLVRRDYSKSTRTHKHADYTKLNLHNLKRAANKDLRWMTTSARNGKHSRSIVLGNVEVLLYVHRNRSGNH